MLKLFNYLSQKKEIFKPLKRGKVGFYTCGPTVYNYAHIGNLRTFIFEDVLKRALEYGGYKVKHVMNITDVDDKTVRDSNVAGKGLKEFTDFYAKEFFKDLKSLNILPADKFPYATKHIPETVKLISILLKKRFAYKTKDGIYFDVTKFKKYGKLSRLKKINFLKNPNFQRIDEDEYSKNEARDFVLWKAKKEGEPFWNAPFGPGRPGWHIECSAMSTKYLGASFDIHSAGVDLLFPHHENEIAQSEGATGKKFVKYFVEGEHLLVNGKKMSKSLGNVFTLRDIQEKNIDPLAFRYLVLSTHYRSQMNFTWGSLAAAEKSLERLKEFVILFKQNLVDANSRRGRAKFSKRNKKILGLRNLQMQDFAETFKKSINDDLNTPKALSVLWNLINQYNKNSENFDAKTVLKLVYDFDKVLGLNLKDIKEIKAPAMIQKMLEERERARKSKDFTRADEIRKQVAILGWQIEDTPSGARLKKSAAPN